MFVKDEFDNLFPAHAVTLRSIRAFDNVPGVRMSVAQVGEGLSPYLTPLVEEGTDVDDLIHRMAAALSGLLNRKREAALGFVGQAINGYVEDFQVGYDGCGSLNAFYVLLLQEVFYLRSLELSKKVTNSVFGDDEEGGLVVPLTPNELEWLTQLQLGLAPEDTRIANDAIGIQRLFSVINLDSHDFREILLAHLKFSDSNSLMSFLESDEGQALQSESSEKQEDQHTLSLLSTSEIQQFSSPLAVAS